MQPYKGKDFENHCIGKPYNIVHTKTNPACSHM